LRGVWLSIVVGATLAGCRESSPRADTGVATVDSLELVRQWARTVDSAARSTKPRDFDFPSRSTEGGGGHLYQLPDSAIRIDIDDFGEMGRHHQRFYSRAALLRLVVGSTDRYDSPLSGNVVRSVVDSVWFTRDSAVSWVDSARIVRRRPDSTLRAHGAEVFSEFQWAVRMARANTGVSDSASSKKSVRRPATRQASSPR
jgi:hypothetical protein